MREHLLLSNLSKSFDLEQSSSLEHKDFDELIKSLSDCMNYHKKKDTVYTVILAILCLLIWSSCTVPFILQKSSFFFQNQGSTEDNVWSHISFGIILLMLAIPAILCTSLIGLCTFEIWERIKPDPFSLTNTDEWEALSKKLQNIPTLADLTENPQIIINFAKVIVQLQQKYSVLIKKNVNPLSTREALAARATQFWHIPAWVFDEPGLQLQKAAYHKVVAQLEQLFIDPPIPYDVTYVITNYLMPVPKFQI